MALFLASTNAAPSIAQDGQQRNVFFNPCERGPWPNVSIINHEHGRFIVFLQDVRPGMPTEVAYQIGSRLCSDMTLVGDSDGLTQRLRNLLTEFGY
jgi:hypothetical protein